MKFGFGSTPEKNGIPHIERFSPTAAIPGGEVTVYGSGFTSRNGGRPLVRFGDTEAALSLCSNNRLIAKVPEGATANTIQVVNAERESQPFPVSLALQIADNLHPVANPVIDSLGNIYVTFSGPRGELFVSCRHDGTIHRVVPSGQSEQWVEGMGIATGLAFDRAGNLFVGDRSGTIFKISPSREIFVFATLEPSVAAYHLAFHPGGELYVAGPTTSSYDRVYRIAQGGDVHVFYRGLGRPQGMAFDRDANLYLAASYAGRRGIVRISPQGHAEHVLSGSALVGLALTPTGRAILAANSALFTLDGNIRGLPLLG